MNELRLPKHVRKFNPNVRTILISVYEVDTKPVFKNMERSCHKQIYSKADCHEEIIPRSESSDIRSYPTKRGVNRRWPLPL